MKIIIRSVNSAIRFLVKLIPFIIPAFLLIFYFIGAPYFAFYMKVASPPKAELIKKTVNKGILECQDDQITGKLEGWEIYQLPIQSGTDCWLIDNIPQIRMIAELEQLILLPHKKRWKIYELSAGPQFESFNKNYAYEKIKLIYEKERKELQTSAQIMFPALIAIVIFIIFAQFWRRRKKAGELKDGMRIKR